MPSKQYEETNLNTLKINGKNKIVQDLKETSERFKLLETASLNNLNSKKVIENNRLATPVSIGYGGSPSLTTGTSPRGSTPMNLLRPPEISYYHPGSMISVTLEQDQLNAEHALTRVENLHEMRPYRLIGKSEPLADWANFIKSGDEIKKIKSKSVREYHVKQNDLIMRYIEIDQLLDSGISVSMLQGYGEDGVNNRHGAPANIDSEEMPLLDQEHNTRTRSNLIMFAIYVNFFVNFVLLVGKAVVTLLTSSLSVVASLVDSILDFLSTFIIWFSTRLVRQRDWKTRHLYPAGRSRLEPIGVLVFSILIMVSFLQIANESIQRLLFAKEKIVVELGRWSVVIMVFTVIAKIFCWLWCRTINSSAIQALAQDAVTDIIFNIFSILFPLLGHYTDTWWCDPLGALFLSFFIIYSWASTGLQHIDNLTGAVASLQDRQVLLYLSYRFADSIKQITALNAYHTGDRIMVEVDLVLDNSLDLKDSHDIGEALQYALETLPFVERAFVHLDYRPGNYTGHLER